MTRSSLWPLAAITTVLLGWARFGATPLALASFESVTLFDSPFRGPLPDLAPPDGAPGLTRQIVLVVMDGLRVDASHALPTLQRLRAAGADRTLLAGQPSFSLPGWTVLGTGAWQEQSGIASNFTEDSIELDTIFLSLKRAGRSTALVGSDGWGQLYAAGVDDSRTFGDPEGGYVDFQSLIAGDDRIYAEAAQVLARPPDFTLIHFLGPDNAGHGWGAASDEYLEIAAYDDALLESLLRNVDLSVATVFVTADHGHVDRGGHGGGEREVLEIPLVAAGAGILPGVYPAAAQVDLAPTLAALLGVGIPSHSVGRPLLDQTDASDEWRSSWSLAASDQLAARTESLLEAIGASPSIDRAPLEQARLAHGAGRFVEARRGSEAFAASLAHEWQRARADRLNSERVGRLPIALVILAAFALPAVAGARRGWSWSLPAVAAAGYFGLWYANYLGVQGLRFSASLFNTEGSIEPFLEARVLEGVVALAVASLAIGAASASAPISLVVRRAIQTAWLVAAGLAIQIVGFFVWWGAVFPWYLPDLTSGFKYYLDVFQTTIFWPVLPLPLVLFTPVFALVGSWSAGWIGTWLRAAFGRTPPPAPPPDGEG